MILCYTVLHARQRIIVKVVLLRLPIYIHDVTISIVTCTIMVA